MLQARKGARSMRHGGRRRRDAGGGHHGPRVPHAVLRKTERVRNASAYGARATRVRTRHARAVRKHMHCAFSRNARCLTRMRRATMHACKRKRSARGARAHALRVFTKCAVPYTHASRTDARVRKKPKCANAHAKPTPKVP